MSLFFPLQRRLREAVQLLEDYKHGTLRPGVTNEQVTLLEVGKEGRWQIHNLSLQPEPLLSPSASTSAVATDPCGLPAVWRAYSGLSCTLSLVGSMEAD